MSKLISLGNQLTGSRELSQTPYLAREGAVAGTTYFHAARELLPFFSRRLSGMGLILNERVTKAGQLEPEEFWSFMVSQLTHGKYGEGKHKPTTKQMKDFYNEVVGSLHDRGWSDYASRFIEVGREMLLSGFDRDGVNEKEREELREYYTDLVLDNENLADGRKQYWHNITANIADEAAKESGSQIPNMFIGTRTGIEHKTYGIGGTHPFTIEDGNETKSIVEIELKAFLESDAYQELPSTTRYQIMNAAKRQLLEGLRTQVDGRAALSLGRVFADVAEHTTDVAYFDTQVNNLTERFDQASRYRIGQSEVERRRFAKSDQLHSELNMWVNMISNPAYGLGGKSEAATKTIAKQIGGLFDAYERRANVSLQAGMFELAQDKLLDAYKKTKSPAIRDLYKNTAEAVFVSINPDTITGQTDFYDQQIESPEATKAFLDKLVARIQDTDYGADAGQFSLADIFVKQAKDLIARAKRQGNDKQAEVYEVTVNKIKTTIREARSLDTTAVRKLSDIHHEVTEELKEAFTTSESQALFTSVTETGLTEEIFGKGKLYHKIAAKIEETGELSVEDFNALVKMLSVAEYNEWTQNETLPIGGRLGVFVKEHGKITRDQLNVLRIETNNQLVEQPLVEFWNTYIADIVDRKIGEGGLHTSSVRQILEDTKAHFTAVKNTVKLLAPEMQQKFIEVGFKQLMLWLDSTDVNNGGILPLSVTNLDTKQKKVVAHEFNSFVKETLKKEDEGKPTFSEGMEKFYFDQANDPEYGKRLVSQIQNIHYGVGGEFSIVDSLMLQVDGMIRFLKPMKNGEKPEEVESAFPEVCYTLLTNVQDAVKAAIDGASANQKTIKSLGALKAVFGRISEMLGKDAAEFAAEKLSLNAVMKGEEAQKAKEKSADTLRQQLKALGTGTDQTDEKERLQNEIDEIMGTAVVEGVEAAKAEFGKYWQSYLALKYEGNTTQGNHGDLSVIADANHQKFMDALKTRDFRYVGAFLRAGVDEMFKALDKIEDPDLRQRMAFEFFNFLSVSPVALELAAREKRRAGENEYQGAKSVRTIGSIQVEFIKRIIDESATNKNRLGDFTTYIETNLAEKNVIPKEKLLCIELLFSYRYAKFGRTFAGENPYEGKKPEALQVGDVDFGQDPKSIASATHGLESSIETSSKMIMKGDMLSVLEQVAAWGNFSPRILMELAVTGEMRTRLIKNKRKFGQSKWNKVREQVYSLLRDDKKDEKWYEKLNKVYKATGKYLFNADTETSVSPALTKIILNALNIPLSDKPEDSKNALELVLAFLDDFGQVATLPGTSFMFDKAWTTLDGDKRSAWESFAYNLIHQIEDLEMSGPAKSGVNEAKQARMADVNATHLILLGKAFKDFGENEDVKAVGTIGSAYVNLLHDILTDSDASGAYKYHEDIRLAAQHVLQNELPLWSDEMMHKFFDGFIAKANSYTDYIKWIEHHNWTGIAFGAGVVPEHTYIGPLLKEKTESSEAASQLIYTKSSRMAVDATLEMLRGYMFLGGRGGKRMAISIVTNEDTDQFKDKIRGVMRVDQEGNFIEQAVRITYALGDAEQKQEMKKILEDLGRKDLSTYIATFTQDEMPVSAQKYISKTGGLMDELAGELTVIEKKYEEALKTMMGGLKPLIRIENGQVVGIEGLSQDSVLLAQLKARGEGWISELEAKMDIQGKREEMKSAADLEKILKERGSFAVFEEMVKQARISGGGENFEVKVIDAMQEFLHVLTETAKQTTTSGNMTQPNMFQVSRNQTGAVLSAIQSGAEAMASSLAKIVNITMEQRTEVMAKFAEIMQKTGLGESSTSVEVLVKTYVDMFTKIITGDAAQVEKIMSMRTAVAEKRGSELQQLLAIEEKLVNEMNGLGEQADRVAIDQIKTEINGLKAIRDQVYKAAGDAVDELKTYGTVTKAYGKSLDERLAASAGEKTAALQFFHNVSAPNGKLGKRAFKYMQWFTGYAAAGETLNFEHLSLDPVVLLNNMGLKDYQQEDLFSQANA